MTSSAFDIQNSEFPRYAEYKDSGVEWLGRIPGHWEVRPFQGLFEMSREKNGKEIVGEMLSISGYRGVEVKQYESDSQKRTKEQLADYRVVRKGQLAVNTMWLNYAGLGVSEVEGHMSPAYRAYDIRPELTGRYAHYLLRSEGYVQGYTGLMQGIRPNSLQIKNEDFKRIPVLIPPKPEQDRIVAFLDERTAMIDELIAKKKRQIELLEEQKAILINRAVTRGLNPDVKLKPSGIDWIGEIPEGWSVAPIKRFSKVQTGLTLGKQYAVNGSVEVPYLRVANVQNGHLALESITSIRVPKNIVDRYTLKEGDVLVAEGGDLDKLGRGCLWNSEIDLCLHQNHVFAVRPYKNRLLPKFLSLALSSKYGQRYFINTGKKTTNLASTSSTSLMNFPLALPCKETQNQILLNLHQMEEDYLKVESQILNEIQSLQLLRSTLIVNAVTGRVQVR